MDYFLIFHHKCLEEPNEGKQLNNLEVELLKLDGTGYGNTNSFSFSDLTIGESFREAILKIIKIINELALNFTNVQLISENNELFTSILPQQFTVRKLSMPYFFTNYVDWRAICNEKYGLGSQSLADLAKQLSLMKTNDEKVILKMVLKRLREEGGLQDSDVTFFKRHKSGGSVSEYSFFRCIGLPFQISKNEIIQKLVEPDRFSIKSYGLSLIFQHGKFSGKAVIKVPAEFTQMILRKDRMFIGRRYVEIFQINQEEFDSYKFREERQREETRNFRDPFQRHEKKKKQSGSSSQSPSYSRSRSNDRGVEIRSLLNQAAIKIRGLPYSLNNWDIEQIFKRFNFVRGSVKLGFLGERKTGEAVVLFPNQEQAERAMVLQGVTVQNRYLELRIISKQNYDRFR